MAKWKINKSVGDSLALADIGVGVPLEIGHAVLGIAKASTHPLTVMLVGRTGRQLQLDRSWQFYTLDIL